MNLPEMYDLSNRLVRLTTSGNSKDGTAVIKAMLVIPSGPGESAYIFCKRQAAMLERTGVTVHSFFVQSRQNPVVVIHELLRLRREIAAFRPDVIHAQNGTVTSFLTALVSMRPLVITFRGSDLNPVPSIAAWRAALGHLLSHLSVLRADHIVCVSEELRRRLWWRKDRISVIPGGVDQDVFFPRSRVECRKILGWTPEPVVLFNAGRFPKVKRLDLAEAAVSAARKAVPDLRLHVLRGEVSPMQIPLHLNAADCLLVTSDWEGSPTMVKEAIACSLPVVSVDVGDVRCRLSYVTPSRIVPRDPFSIGAAIVEILHLACRSDGAARALHFTERDEVMRIHRIYQSLTVER